jgi:hypothetical protein
MVQSKSFANPRPWPTEEEAVASQLTGIGYLIYRGISDLTRKINPNRFKLFLSQRFRTTDDVDGLLARSAIAASEAVAVDRDLDLLYDPGVFAMPAITVPAYIRDLPLCRKFASISEAVMEDIGKAEMRQLDGYGETRKCELLALRLEDNPLLEFVGGYIRKYKQLKMFHELVRLRFNQPKVWQKMVKGWELVAKKTTINEYNAFILFQSLADGMNSFLPS